MASIKKPFLMQIIEGNNMEMLSGVVRRGFTDVQRPDNFVPYEPLFVYDPETNNYHPREEPAANLGSMTVRCVA